MAAGLLNITREQDIVNRAGYLTRKEDLRKYRKIYIRTDDSIVWLQQQGVGLHRGASWLGVAELGFFFAGTFLHI